MCTVNPGCPSSTPDCDDAISVSNGEQDFVFYKNWRATYKIHSNWISASNDGTLKIEISGFKDIAGNLGNPVSFTTGDSGTDDLATAIIDIDTVKPELTSFNLVSDGNRLTNSNTPPDITQYYAKVDNKITFTFNTSEPVLKPTIKLYTTNSDSNMFDFTVSESTDNGVTCVTVYGAKDENGAVPETKYCDKWVAIYTIPATWNSNYDGNIIIEVSNYEDEHGNIGNPLTFSETSTDDSTKITVPITIDTTLPTLTSVSIESSNTTNTLAKANDDITLSFTVNETLLNDPTVQILGKTATKDTTDTTVTPPSYKYTYEVVSGDRQGTATFSISVTDLAGNVTSGVNAITTGNNVIVDTTPPTLQAPTTGDTDKITSATYNNDANIWDIANSGYLNKVENENAQTLSFQCNDNHIFSDSTLLEVWFQNTVSPYSKYPPGTVQDPFYNNNNLTLSNSNSTAEGDIILSLLDI